LVALAACIHEQPRPQYASEPPPPPPSGARDSARIPATPARKPPTAIARAGQKPLDPAVHGTPLGWPTKGVLISGFGERERDQHDGIDLASPEGTLVRAASSGTVLFAGTQRGYGKLVLLRHAGDIVTVYAHNSENLVKAGMHVSRGDIIAKVGHTGNATGPHLHFEVRVASRPRDPLTFLR
jgi:murein DD-endopeptidase MepM/ murein hydrolase activator NlpD